MRQALQMCGINTIKDLPDHLVDTDSAFSIQDHLDTAEDLEYTTATGLYFSGKTRETGNVKLWPKARTRWFGLVMKIFCMKSFPEKSWCRFLTHYQNF